MIDFTYQANIVATMSCFARNDGAASSQRGKVVRSHVCTALICER